MLRLQPAHQPATMSLSDPRQQEIAEEFAYFGDWSERYQYLIDLGRQLPALPEQHKVPANLVEGCQSQVWLLSSGDASRLEFLANSDSTIVSGLIALLLRVYSGRPAVEILQTEPEFIEAVGLGRHLSATRSNGLGAMLGRIRSSARQALQDAPA